jgi:hypothetical protein
VSMPWATVQALARDLPETSPRVTSRRPMARSSASPLTWAVVWSSEVLTSGVNPRRIDGMQEVRRSAPRPACVGNLSARMPRHAKRSTS